MPPYPDKAAKGSTSSCDYVPVSAAVHVNSMQNPLSHQNAKVENGEHPVPQPGLPLAVPYLSGDSDSDDQFAILPTSAPDLRCLVQPQQPLNNNHTIDANKLSNGDAPALEQPRDANPGPQTTQCKSGTSARIELPSEGKPKSNGTSGSKRTGTFPSDEPVPPVKSEDIAAQMDSHSPDCIVPQNSKEGSPSDCIEPDTTNPSPDKVVVSKNCLDGVLEHLSNRISELENIRERKKARFERLSSPAYLAQSSAMTLWPQAVAAQRTLTGPNVAMVPASGLGVMPGAIPPGAPGCPTSSSGTPFVHGAPNAPGTIPAPPPPPPPDAADRKQSRYWTADEHQRFLAAIKTCGPKSYVQIAEIVGTRNAKQVRTHAQKFQKKLEREEAKRRENLQRHGAHAGAPAVSAAAVAVVAAAMQHGAAAARHLTCESSGHRGFAPFLLPFQAPGSDSARGPFRGPFPVPPGRAASSADGSSSTNDVSNEHQRSFEHALAGPSAQNAAMAAVAAEAAALGGRIFAQPVQNIARRADAGASNAGAESSAVVNGAKQKALIEIAPAKNGENCTNSVSQSASKNHPAKEGLTDCKGLATEDTSKSGELSKDSNSSAKCSGIQSDDENGNRGLNTDGAASQRRVGDKASRFRSCDELSGICAIVKNAATPKNASVVKSTKMQSSSSTGADR